MKVSEFFVIGCLCEYRVYILVNLVPNYGVDSYRGIGQKVEGVPSKRNFFLCFVVCNICRLVGLEKLC